MPWDSSLCPCGLRRLRRLAILEGKDTNKRAKNKIKNRFFYFVLSSESIFDEVKDTKKMSTFQTFQGKI